MKLGLNLRMWVAPFVLSQDCGADGFQKLIMQDVHEVPVKPLGRLTLLRFVPRSKDDARSGGKLQKIPRGNHEVLSEHKANGFQPVAVAGILC